MFINWTPTRRRRERVAQTLVRGVPGAFLAELNVIIPTHNRAGQLRRCLEGLGRQTQSPDDFDVTVVVDGSTDATGSLLADLTLPFRLSVIHQSRSGQQVARNRGAAATSGRYCLFLDDDIEPAPGLIAAHLRLLRGREDAVGLGAMPMTLAPEADWFARCFAEQWNTRYAGLDAGRWVPAWVDCYGGNLSLPRTAFEQVGGFAPDIPSSHDIELGHRLERQGFTFVYLPEAVGGHAERKTGRQLSAMLERHGRAAVELYRRHPGVLPSLLGSFARPSRRSATLRRVLLAMQLPPALLTEVGRVLGASRQRRWGRFLSGYCFWYGVRREVHQADLWWRLTHGTPILLYHAFGAAGEPGSRFVMPVRRFARQMAWLRLARYRVIGLEELLCCRREFRLPPPRSVVLTMDDGYADNVRLAVPVLRRYGFPATVFVVSGRIGGSNQWSGRSELAGRALASRADLRQLLEAGVAIGAHTRTHPALPMLSDAAARDEIEGSRRDLERELGVPVEIFAYPFGAHDDRIRALARGAGFAASCGVRNRLNDATTDIQALDRTEIRGSDSLLRFALGLILGDPEPLRTRRLRLKGRTAELPARAPQ
jgi:peptidoglycan/xylan/chitin deacetylase (PgdA/CDA1 family)/glycosyltransferase involved in cell wall biosynthesis